MKFFIVNTTDRPWESLVAYQTTDGKLNYCDRRKKSYDGMPFYKATPIEDFGIHVRLHDDGTYEFTQSGQSIAKYEDGKPRAWQGLSKFFHKVHY